MMIELYSQTKPIEVQLDEEGNAFFKARDVFNALDLTWIDTTTSLYRRGVSEDDLRRGDKLLKISTPQNIRGVEINKLHNRSEAVYMSEIAMYQLAFRSNRPEAVKFTRWAAEKITNLRKYGCVSLEYKFDLRRHTNPTEQKYNSKIANAVNNRIGGVKLVKIYNAKNCRTHTGYNPTDLKEIGRTLGLKSKQVSSGKEAARHLKPEAACAMSLCDKLIYENGLNEDEAMKLTSTKAMPLFEELIKLMPVNNLILE